MNKASKAAGAGRGIGPAARSGWRVLAKAILILAVGAGMALAWPWSTDMMWTPVLSPFEKSMSAPPPGTLPQGGGELRPPGREPTNPIPPTPANLEQGRRLFLTYCAVCHGEDAKGGGTVGEKFILAGFDLTLSRPETYIYTRIRQGGVYMPNYREALSPEETWLVVNYVRSLQTE